MSEVRPNLSPYGGKKWKPCLHYCLIFN
jgi:hypothetical protein